MDDLPVQTHRVEDLRGETVALDRPGVVHLSAGLDIERGAVQVDVLPLQEPPEMRGCLSGGIADKLGRGKVCDARG